jgi:hypothetical protein
MDKIKSQPVGVEAHSLPPHTMQLSTGLIPPHGTVLYSRFSTRNQVEDQGSIPSLRDLLTRVFADNGYTLDGEFVDAGSTTDHRKLDYEQKIE